MGRKACHRIADPRVKEVGDQIALWRRTRERRTPMPAELWAKAVALARVSGTYPVARAVRVDYASLARRVAEAFGEQTGRAKSTAFVEMRGADLVGGATVSRRRHQLLRNVNPLAARGGSRRPMA
jgi:hypothetical protein